MFNTNVNNLFTLWSVQETRRPIDRALDLAKKRGMNQSEFADAMDVLPQHLTNWKRRGMPPEYHAKAADVLRCTVDELLGRGTFLGVRESMAQWPFPVPFSDYDTLHPTQKRELAEIVEDRISRFKAASTTPKQAKKKR